MHAMITEQVSSKAEHRALMTFFSPLHSTGVLLLTSGHYSFSITFISLLHCSERKSWITGNLFAPSITGALFVALHMPTVQVICHSLQGHGYSETSMNEKLIVQVISHVTLGSSLDIRRVYAKFYFLTACIFPSPFKNAAAIILFLLEIDKLEAIIHSS